MSLDKRVFNPTIIAVKGFEGLGRNGEELLEHEATSREGGKERRDAHGAHEAGDFDLSAGGHL